MVSEETYVEQALYWEKPHQPLLEYLINTYQPGPGAGRLPAHRRVPAPVPRPGLPTLPNGATNPAYDDVQVNGTPDGRVAAARGFIRRAYQGADTTMRLAQTLLRRAT